MDTRPSFLAVVLYAAALLGGGHLLDHRFPLDDVRPTLPDPGGRNLRMTKPGPAGEDFAFQLYSIKEILPLPTLNAAIVRQHDGTVTVFHARGWDKTVKDGESYHVAFHGETVNCSIYSTTVPGVPYVRVASGYNRGDEAIHDKLLRAVMAAYPPKVQAP